MPYKQRGYIEVQKDTKDMLERVAEAIPQTFYSWDEYLLYIIGLIEHHHGKPTIPPQEEEQLDYREES